MNVAIIPARGGSKRIPRKNIKQFCGRPMISYAIEIAKKSNLFDRIIVSTEDEEIAAIANILGAETPFVRPVDFADDHTPTVPVIAQAIEFCLKLGWKIDNVCCIYPCNPFISIEDLRDSFALLGNSLTEYCFPVTEFPSPIQRALKLSIAGKTQPLYSDFETTRTQDLEVVYYDVGQFYWGNADLWIKKSIIHSNGLGFRIPNWRVIDIDSNDDWKRAELLYSVIRKENIY